jgi:hypothetical protein
MAFHNFERLINKHKRTFQISQKTGSGIVSNSTTRYQKRDYGTPVNVNGVFETITEKDYKRFPDIEHINSSLKVTTTPTLLNDLIPQIKDKITYNNVDYWLNKVHNEVYYGNYYILFLEKIEYDV